MQVRKSLDCCRRNIAKLIGARDLARVIFTGNGTDSLNLALWGLLRTGDHIVCTTWEHNSVQRPLQRLIEQRGIAVSRVAIGPGGNLDPDQFWQAVKPETRLICLLHASNVTGQIQPVAEIGRKARAAGVRFLVDAAQTLGAVEIDVEQMGIDLLAAPGESALVTAANAVPGCGPYAFVNTSSIGGDAIKVALREVIDAEEKAKPLSDDALADALKKRGIEIARRTVAKYRDQLGIPPARLRRTY